MPLLRLFDLGLSRWTFRARFARTVQSFVQFRSEADHRCSRSGLGRDPAGLGRRSDPRPHVPRSGRMLLERFASGELPMKRAVVLGLLIFALPSFAQERKSPEEMARIRATSRYQAVEWSRPTLSLVPRVGIAAGDMGLTYSAAAEFAYA